MLPASADAFIVAATGPQGLALYWVPRATGGLQIRAEPCADGGASGWLTLIDVQLPDDHRLADTGAAELLRAMGLDWVWVSTQYAMPAYSPFSRWLPASRPTDQAHGLTA